MLKRIPVTDLRLGMFVHEFCGAWIDHPFWRSSFKLEDVKDLERIKASSVTELWIDIAQGADAPPEPVLPQLATSEVLTETLQPEAKSVQPASFDEEILRAARICETAKHEVTSMFREARMGKALDASGAMSLVEEISCSVQRNPDALISLARLKNKDNYTYMHSVAVCALMIALARQLQMSEEQTREAGLAGLLHDVGKMAIPDGILNKPGKLTDEEFQAVKNHPVEGHKLLLGGQGVSEAALDVCLHHHERMDGKGYPHGLKGEEISLFARMGAVCDVYDAITSNRSYKQGWDASDSIRKMTEWSGSHFDEKIFQAFVKCIGIYPTGTLVRLKSERLGMVVAQSDSSLLKPTVKAFFSTRSRNHLTPELLDFSSPGVQDRIIGREDPERWQLKNLDALWLGDAAKVS